MKIIDPSMLGFVSGGRGNNGGDRVDNGGRTSSSKNGRDRNYSGDMYGKHTSPDCVNGMLTGMAEGAVGGPLGMAAGLAKGTVTGGCFKDAAHGGGNIGTGPGGNKSSGSCSGKNGSGGCSW